MRVYSLQRKAQAVTKAARHLHHYKIAVVVQGWVTVEASLILIHRKQDGFLMHKRLCTIIAPPKRQHLQVVGDEIFYAERPREINCSGFQPVSLLQHWAAINWWQLYSIMSPTKRTFLPANH